MTINGSVNVTVKQFTDPSSNSTQLGTLLKGTVIIADKNNGTWLHIIMPKAGWCNARVGEGMTSGDITWRTVAPTPPPPPPPPTTVTIVSLTVTPEYSDGTIGAPVKMVPV